MSALLKRILALLQADSTGIAVLAQSVVVLVVARYHLSSGQVAAVEAVTVAVLGVLAAAWTRPFHVQAISGLLAAVGTLLAAFSVHVPPGWVGVWNAVLAVVLFLWREHKVLSVADIRKRKVTVQAGPAPQRL